jgi:hypothetical protein
VEVRAGGQNWKEQLKPEGKGAGELHNVGVPGMLKTKGLHQHPSTDSQRLT